MIIMGASRNRLALLHILNVLSHSPRAQENKAGEDLNMAETPDEAAPTPMDAAKADVDMADVEDWPATKEETPEATPDGALAHGGKRARRSACVRDDSTEHAQHIDTAASTECEDDPPEPGAGARARTPGLI